MAGGLIAALVAWRVISAVLGSEPELPSGTVASGTPTTIEGNGNGVPASTAEVAADFPLPALGTRLEFKILGLGDHPQRCTAVGFVVGGDQRTVYHHLCGKDADARSDVYFFLVRIVNHSGLARPIARANLEIATQQGRTLPALDVESANATRAHYFPEGVELGPDSRLKAFVAFDASPAFTPARLLYADGTQALVIHLRGTWVGA
ncbi:MAG TPA: hypothetical protein VE669_09495 [Actinomycetota bacterium]|nr:hypothetical protein [Actinomycetota bacterium]